MFAFIGLEGAGTLVSPQCSRNNWKFRPDLLSHDIPSYLKAEGVSPALLDKVFRAVERMVRSLDKVSNRPDLQNSIGVVVNMATLFFKAFRREDLLSFQSRKEFSGALSNKLCNADRCAQF